MSTAPPGGVLLEGVGSLEDVDDGTSGAVPFVVFEKDVEIVAVLLAARVISPELVKDCRKLSELCGWLTAMASIETAFGLNGPKRCVDLLL